MSRGFQLPPELAETLAPHLARCVPRIKARQRALGKDVEPSTSHSGRGSVAVGGAPRPAEGARLSIADSTRPRPGARSIVHATVVVLRNLTVEASAKPNALGAILDEESIAALTCRLSLAVRTTS